MNKPIRHGEALLLPVEHVFSKAKHQTEAVIAHSETGHHHVLESTEAFEIETISDETFLRLFKPARLVHRKATLAHNTLTVAPGTYRVIPKKEYNPFTKVMDKVWD